MSSKGKPLWVYLDFNVFINLRKGLCTIADLKNLIGTSIAVFPYSLAHIEEVHNIKESKSLSLSCAINEHLKLIDEISKRQYMEKDDSDRYYKKISYSAFDVYKKVAEPNRDGDMPYDYYANFFTEEQKQNIRIALSLDSNQLNNIEAHKIIEHLNTNFLYNQHNATYLQIIELAKKQYKSEIPWQR